MSIFLLIFNTDFFFTVCTYVYIFIYISIQRSIFFIISTQLWLASEKECNALTRPYALVSC